MLYIKSFLSKSQLLKIVELHRTMSSCVEYCRKKYADFHILLMHCIKYSIKYVWTAPIIQANKTQIVNHVLAQFITHIALDTTPAPTAIVIIITSLQSF